MSNPNTQTKAQAPRDEPRFTNSDVQHIDNGVLVEQDDEEVVIRIRKTGDFGLTTSGKMSTVANTVGHGGMTYVTVIDEHGNDQKWTLKLSLWRPVRTAARYSRARDYDEERG